jgi:hypothetical protein
MMDSNGFVVSEKNTDMEKEERRKDNAKTSKRRCDGRIVSQWIVNSAETFFEW